MASLLKCVACHFSGSDVRLVGCGCTLHAQCVPISMVANIGTTTTTPVQPNTVPCIHCGTMVAGIHMLPMSLDELDQARDLRFAQQQQQQDSDDVVKAEAVYLNLSQSSRMMMTVAENNNRTGRWNAQEIAYTDFLIQAFDQGKLPLADGIRLNDFLGEMLMCKGSRLTKKMKNAKLSLRTYELHKTLSSTLLLDTELLSTLQESFLTSITEEPLRLELRFNITKCWRTHFSNFLLQLGSTLLDASDWITSLEAMEQRAARAEEVIRKARRRRMGLALKTDVRTAPDGVFYAGKPVPRKEQHGNTKKPAAAAAQPFDLASVHSVTSSDDGSEAEMISNMLDLEGANAHMEEFSNMFTDLIADRPTSASPAAWNSSGSFLEEIVGYMEQHNLPFEHVDVWVPSYGNDDVLRLCHAGHATRHDLDPSLICTLHEYGEYSTKFSFAPGIGLPGRVYSGGSGYIWECRIDQADPKLFERAGGAKVYGIKTALGISLSSKAIGRIIVVMYGVQDIELQANVAERCVRDLEAFCPEPKWKLVVEMGPDPTAVSGQQDNKTDSSSSAIDHYVHRGRSPVMTRPDRTESVSSVNSAAVATAAAGGMMHDASQDNTKALEQTIATLLGEHMPLSDLQGGGGGNQVPDYLLPDFMALRLLLLRSAARRTPEEVDIIDVIVKSYLGYIKGNKRSDKDVAYLLVNDWRYLNRMNNIDSKMPATAGSSNNNKAPDTYTSHMMEAPAVPTYSTSGQPVRMPFTVKDGGATKRMVEPVAVSETKKRRVSESVGVTDHFDHNHGDRTTANIVDEL